MAAIDPWRSVDADTRALLVQVLREDLARRYFTEQHLADLRRERDPSDEIAEIPILAERVERLKRGESALDRLPID